MADVESIRIESDERGFELHVVVGDDIDVDDEGRAILNVQAVAEELYDAVKGAIGPWLAERDEAYASYRARAGGLTDDEREEEVRCAALGLEGPNAKQYRYEQVHGHD